MGRPGNGLMPLGDSGGLSCRFTLAGNTLLLRTTVLFLRVFACPTFINKPENRAKMDHFLSNGPSFPLPPPSRSPTNQDKNRKNYLHYSGRNVRRTYRRFRGWTGFFLIGFAVLFFQWPAGSDYQDRTRFCPGFEN